MERRLERTIFVCTVFAVSSLFVSTINNAHSAQTYPTRNIRLVVPFTPGGNVDLTARAVAPGIAERLGGNIVVDNRAGAGGHIAAATVASAAPDGHTLLMGASGVLSISVAASEKPPYHPTRDFIPINMVSSVPMLLVVPAPSSVKTVEELIKIAKASPGKLNMAISGRLSTSELTGALFEYHTGTKFTYVPYKGGGQAATDLIAGNVDAMFATLPSAIDYVRIKRLRGILVTTLDGRVPGLPDVPTVKELGMPNVESVNFSALLAPAGTPQAIVRRLNEAAVFVLRAPATREAFARFGASTNESTPEQAIRFINADIDKWRKVIRAAGISVQP